MNPAMRGAGQYSLPNVEISERAAFLGRTYYYLLGAVLGCIALVTVIAGVPAISEPLMKAVGASRFSMLFLMLGWMAAQWFASRLAHQGASPGMQYFGLGLAVVSEALLLAPLLMLAERVAPGISKAAGIVTGLLFGSLTALVYYTRWNFKWLGPALWLAGIAVVGLIFASFFVHIQLGIWFVAAMLVFSCGYILYDTSNVMHEYPTHMHVGAALTLFTSIAQLFWYVVRFLLYFTSWFGDD